MRKRKEEGQIIKRGEGRYLVRWTSDERDAKGRKKQPSRIVEGDYGQALAFLANQINGKNNGSPAPLPERTFASYVENEWAHYTGDKWKGSTQITHGSFVKRHIVPFFAAFPLGQIKPTTIVDFHKAMEEKGLSRKTRRNIHAILTRMFSYAIELELIDKNPVKRGIAPMLEKTEKPALSEQQLHALFDELPIRWKAFYMVLGLTSVRSGEALGLKWADVDFASRDLHIRRAIYRGKETTPKTNASLRHRPMVDILYRALLNHKTMKGGVGVGPNDYVFASSSGRPANPDQLRKLLQATLKRLGIELADHADGLHLLRHTSGSVVYRHTGGDLKATQDWLGHSSSRITADVYVHLAKDQQRATADRLQQAVLDGGKEKGQGHA